MKYMYHISIILVLFGDFSTYGIRDVDDFHYCSHLSGLILPLCSILHIYSVIKQYKSKCIKQSRQNHQWCVIPTLNVAHFNFHLVSLNVTFACDQLWKVSCIVSLTSPCKVAECLAGSSGLTGNYCSRAQSKTFLYHSPPRPTWHKDVDGFRERLSERKTSKHESSTSRNVVFLCAVTAWWEFWSHGGVSFCHYNHNLQNSTSYICQKMYR